MMTSLAWLAAALACYVAGAIASLCLYRHESLAIPLGAVGAALGGMCGMAAALPVLLYGRLVTATFTGPLADIAPLSLRLDALAAFMIVVISLLAVVTALYSLAYLPAHRGRAWALGFVMNLFIASMVALVVADNAFYFIILLEAMSLSAYLLVRADQNDDAIHAGRRYLLTSHAGLVLIIIAFWLFYRQSGTLDFAALRQTARPASQASLIFLPALLGFGAMAGMMPLHGWLPRTQPAAPSHASALISAVMVKIGIFGLIKVGIDLLGATEIWWGVAVLALGALSAVLGGLYGLVEHDIKRLLAYHTVENTGIILIGIGAGMIGVATHHPLLATLGLLGGLYHLLNHAVFKGLLLLGAGAVIYRLHTRDMEKMGGLARLMPYTAMTFLIGCMAISALPPLNGFVSEWFTYQSLFTLARQDGFPLRLVAPIAIVLLAITGAFAAMCTVKLYGVSFSGAPRSENAARASDVPWPMTAALLLLALLCVLLGVGAGEVAPVIARIAAGLTDSAVPAVSHGVLVFPGDARQTTLATPLIFILLLALPLLPLLLYIGVKGARLNFRRRGAPWACGYAYEPAMAASAASFTQPLRVMFAPLYRIRKSLDPAPLLQNALAPRWTRPPRASRAAPGEQQGRWIPHGDFWLYCLYVVAVSAILLLATMA